MKYDIRPELKTLFIGLSRRNLEELLRQLDNGRPVGTISKSFATDDGLVTVQVYSEEDKPHYAQEATS